MEPELILEGDQLLYSNQFDQLTYSADQIVLMSSQLSQVLKKLSYSYSSKDFIPIMNKNLTAFIFWFTLDALYFVSQNSYEVDRINYIRKKKSNSSTSGQLFQEQKFITKLRALSMLSKGYKDLNQIKQITVDELIQLFEKEHAEIQKLNDEKIQRSMLKSIQQKQSFIQKLKKFDLDYRQTSRLFAYYKFDKQMIRFWNEQIQKKKAGQKCQVCNRYDNKIIKCQKCDLTVHAQCYCKLGKQYLKNQFICENCQKNLTQKTNCIFCPRKGGYFLQVQSQKLSNNPIFKIIKQQNGLRLKLQKVLTQKKMYIHLSCSLWHHELRYCRIQNKLINIHRIDRKKSQSSCFQCGTNIGITIPCANQNCRRYYHPQCAKSIPLSTCIINANNKLLIQLYCQRHSRPQIYQKLKDNILANLNSIKKFFKDIDYELTRMKSMNGIIYSSDQKISKNQWIQRYDFCMYCRQDYGQGKQKIINCWKCYNWYHVKCAQKCQYCEFAPTK